MLELTESRYNGAIRLYTGGHTMPGVTIKDPNKMIDFRAKITEDQRRNVKIYMLKGSFEGTATEKNNAAVRDILDRFFAEHPV